VRRRIVLQIFAKTAKPIVYPSAGPVVKRDQVRQIRYAVRSFFRYREPAADVLKAMKTCALVASDGFFFKVKTCWNVSGEAQIQLLFTPEVFLGKGPENCSGDICPWVLQGGTRDLVHGRADSRLSSWQKI